MFAEHSNSVQSFDTGSFTNNSAVFDGYVQKQK